jgi:hypothetical protein
MNILSKLTIPDHNIVLTIYDTFVMRGYRTYYSYDMSLNDVVLFAGNDYSPSPLDNVDSLDTLIGLFSFLTLMPGDTDEEYFQHYTKDQLIFANGCLCEELKTIPYDHEAGDFDDYYNVSSDDTLYYKNYTIT